MSARQPTPLPDRIQGPPPGIAVAGEKGGSFEDPENVTRIDVPTGTLSPVSSSTMNSLKSSRSDAAISNTHKSSRISAEHSFDSNGINSQSHRPDVSRTPLKEEINRINPTSKRPSTSIPKQPQKASRPLSPASPQTNGAMNGITNGIANLATSQMSQSTERDGMPRSTTTPLHSALRSSPSFGELPSLTTSRSAVNGFTSSEDQASARNVTSPTANTTTSPDGRAMSPDSQPQWSSAVGRAGLGKSGRVIEKLMAENDALKRDLKSEKLKAEESKDAVKMLEIKLQQQLDDNEKELHQATLDRAVLKRKERQLDDIKDAVNEERQRAVAANESARASQERAEASVREATSRANAAINQKMLVDGSYEAFRGSYRDEKALIAKMVEDTRKTVDELYARRNDDAKRLARMQELIDTQDKQLSEITEQKEAIAKAFQDYKQEQEAGLVDIKRLAQEQEARYAAQLAESSEVLGRLKWALNIQEQRNTAR